MIKSTIVARGNRVKPLQPRRVEISDYLYNLKLKIWSNFCGPRRTYVCSAGLSQPGGPGACVRELYLKLKLVPHVLLWQAGGGESLGAPAK